SEGFTDRRQAGKLLAAAVKALALADPVVLALPRGGVPVGFEVAKVLGAPLDIVLVRKIGAPGHEEYGIGALVDGASPQVVIDEVVCLSSPEPFYAVGAHYRDFRQTEDEEVIALLAEAKNWARERSV